MGPSRARRPPVHRQVSAPELIDTVARMGAGRVLVARALDPELRGELAASIDCEELPFVRGRTVVPDDLGDDDLVVAGHPNFLGVFDLPAVPRWVAVTGTWSSLRPVVGTPTVVPAATAVDRAPAERSLDAGRDVAKGIDQLRGVTLAFPPASPVLVVLVPTDPVAVAARIGLPGCTALSGFEELPGGLRIELPADTGTAAAGYAQALEAALEHFEEDTEAGWRQRPAP